MKYWPFVIMLYAITARLVHAISGIAILPYVELTWILLLFSGIIPLLKASDSGVRYEIEEIIKKHLEEGETPLLREPGRISDWPKVQEGYLVLTNKRILFVRYRTDMIDMFRTFEYDRPPVCLFDCPITNVLWKDNGSLLTARTVKLTGLSGDIYISTNRWSYARLENAGRKQGLVVA